MGLRAPSFLSIIISALFFIFSLSTSWWFCTFFWMIPIFYNVLLSKEPFLLGFFWGCSFYSLHSITLFLLIIREGSVGLLWMPLFFIGYMSLFSGLWFWIVQKCFIIKKGWAYFLMVHGIINGVTIGYFYFIDRLVLSPLGVNEGYPLVFPLIGCAENADLLILLPWVGKWFLLSCLVGLQQVIAHAVKFYKEGQSKKYWVVVTGLIVFFSMPFIIGFFRKEYQKNVPDWIEKIAVIVPDEKSSLTPYSRALDLCLKMEQAARQWPDIKIFFTPESAFPYTLNETSRVLNLWTDNVLHQDKWFFIGAQRQKRDAIMNTVFLMHQCRIIQLYDKSRLIPFFERKVALPATFQRCNDLFLKEKRPFTTAAQQSSALLTTHPLLGNYTMYICSEWLFKEKKEASLYIIFMKLNRFKQTPWKTLLDKAIRLNVLETNKPTLIISENPILYIGKNIIKIKKIS